MIVIINVIFWHIRVVQRLIRKKHESSTHNFLKGEEWTKTSVFASHRTGYTASPIRRPDN